MAIKRRLKGYAGMRVDWPHIRSLESSVSFDIDSVLRGLVTGSNKPYLIRGFNIVIPDASIPASSIQIEVADAAIMHSSAAESGTILTVAEGTANEVLDSANTKVIGSFQNGVPNYIAIDYRRVTDTNTADQTAGWSPSQKIEFQRGVPIGNILEYRFVVTTNGFGNNLPLYIVNVDNSGSVSSITKGVDSLFRLGKGGAVPNPYFTYDYGGLKNDQTTPSSRREWISTDGSLNPVSILPADPAAAFDYGDWSISSLKEWMDALMSRFKETTNSAFWYTNTLFPGSEPNIFDVWWDSVGSVLTGNGNLSYNLVLESSQVTAGAYQSFLTDSNIIPGESYVIGLSSGNKATLQSFNSTQLIINSLIKDGFTYDEVLYNRRIFQLNSAIYKISDQKNGQSDNTGFINRTYGAVQRITPTVLGTPNVTTWSFANKDTFAEITIQKSSSHGLNPQDPVELAGFAAGSNPPNGSYLVAKVISADTFTVETATIPTGSPNSTNAEVNSSIENRLPYMPKFSVTNAVNVTNNITLTIPSHHFVSPLTPTADLAIGTNTLENVSDLTSLSVGMNVIHGDLPSDTEITKIDIPNSRVYLTENATASSTSGVTIKSQITVEGLEGTTDIPIGRYQVDTVSGDDVTFAALATPTGLVASPASSTVAPLRYSMFLTVEDAGQTEYNLVDSDAVVLNDMQLYYDIGPDTLPSIGDASGVIILDGVIAVTTVSNPVRISSITNDAVDIIVNTSVDHGLSSVLNVDYTVFGDTTLTQYVRSYENVELEVVTTTQFKIKSHDITAFPVDFVNGGSDQVFARSSDNPFPGPVQWDSDLIIKGIIGDKSFTIPQTAIATGTSTANQFNNNGLTGTAYLLDGEVAYVTLERNKSVSGGAFYSVNDGKTIVGSTPPLDKEGVNLVSGDYIKFEEENESFWAKIDGVPGTPVTTSTFSLISDNGQPTTADQRSTNNGQLVYSKGIYDTVTVAKHYKVDSDPNIYWIAVRRDNNSLKSKVYLKGMELEVGETRAINDNEPTNHLQYTGAGSEAAVNPNYTEIDSASYASTQNIDIESIDVETREVSFTGTPDLGFQLGDQIKDSNNAVYEIKDVLTSKTVIIDEDVSALPVETVVFRRLNSVIKDTDNLTLAIRKDDREIGGINTTLNKAIYDESFYIQKMDLTNAGGGTGYIASGDYVYVGPQNNPTGLAWVLHGTSDQIISIEGSNINMPGGHASVGVTSILIVLISGVFSDTDLIQQNSAYTGYDLDNVGDPVFEAPTIAGGPSNDGVELALPPNKRTQVVGASGYVVWPTHAAYKASLDVNLTGEELLVIANDTIRQANVDYFETFGGPKAKIKIIRDLPANTSIRVRNMSSFGSAVTKAASSVDLQKAYDSGNVIQSLTGRPVIIKNSSGPTGTGVLYAGGTIGIDTRSGGIPTGGIIGQTEAGVKTDGTFDVGASIGKPRDVWSQNFKTKTHTSHPDSEKVELTTAAQTSNASATTLSGSVIGLAEDKSIRVKVKGTARSDNGNFGVASFELHGLFHREAGGDVTLSSDIESSVVGSSGDGDLWALTFGINTGTQEISVIAFGSALGSVQWALTIEYQKVGLAT